MCINFSVATWSVSGSNSSCSFWVYSTYVSRKTFDSCRITGWDLALCSCGSFSYADAAHMRWLGVNVVGAKKEDAGRILADTIRTYMQDMDVVNGLQALGYSSSDIPDLVTGTIPQHRVTKICPRPFDQEQLSKLFEASLTAYWHWLACIINLIYYHKLKVYIFYYLSFVVMKKHKIQIRKIHRYDMNVHTLSQEAFLHIQMVCILYLVARYHYLACNVNMKNMQKSWYKLN